MLNAEIYGDIVIKCNNFLICFCLNLAMFFFFFPYPCPDVISWDFEEENLGKIATLIYAWSVSWSRFRSKDDCQTNLLGILPINSHNGAQAHGWGDEKSPHASLVNYYFDPSSGKYSNIPRMSEFPKKGATE